MRHLVLFTALAAAAWAQRPPAAPAPAPKPKPAAPSVANLKYPPLKPVSIPTVEQTTLPNGLKLYLLEDHELPLVSGVALVRTGNLFDPPDRVGLATVTGEVLRSGGTREKTGDEIDERLESMAAAIESGIDETYGSVSFSALKQNTDEVVQLFHDLLTSPEFRADKLELIKGQLRSSIARRNDDPAGIASREFASLVYGRHTPYGATMEYETVDRIRREDLVAFYQRYYFPANVMLALRGDFSAAEMRARIEKVFGGWAHKQEPVPSFPPVDHKAKPGIYVGAKKGLPQTFFTGGHLGGKLNDKDYPALEVAADILGGGFSSRLFQRVRSRMGAAYSIGSDWGAAFHHPGLFTISGSTRGSSTTVTLKAVREEMEGMRSEEVSNSELADARDRVLNSFVFNFDTKAKTLNRLLTYEYYGYPKDFIQQYQKAVAAVTRADVLRVAREHFHPDQMVIVAVGDPGDFQQTLGTLGLPVTSLDLTIKEPATAGANASPQSIERGKQLLQRAQQAVGGVAKLEAIKDFTEVAELHLDPSVGATKVTRTNRWLAPSAFRQDNQLPFGRLSVYWDGQAGWIANPQGRGPLMGPQLAQAKGESLRVYHRLLLSDRIAGRVVTEAGDGVVEISESGDVVRLTLDEKSGMPRQLSYRNPQPKGPPAEVTETFTAFATVDGVEMPSKLTLDQNGKRFADVAVKEQKVNTGLQPADLSRWR